MATTLSFHAMGLSRSVKFGLKDGTRGMVGCGPCFAFFLSNQQNLSFNTLGVGLKKVIILFSFFRKFLLTSSSCCFQSRLGDDSEMEEGGR